MNELDNINFNKSSPLTTSPNAILVIADYSHALFFFKIGYNVLCMSSGTCTHFQINTNYLCHCLYTVLGTGF